MRCADRSIFTLRGSTISARTELVELTVGGALCESTTAARCTLDTEVCQSCGNRGK